MVVKLNTAVKQEEIFSFLEKNSSIVTFSRTTNG